MSKTSYKANISIRSGELKCIAVPPKVLKEGNFVHGQKVLVTLAHMESEFEHDKQIAQDQIMIATKSE